MNKLSDKEEMVLCKLQAKEFGRSWQDYYFENIRSEETKLKRNKNVVQERIEERIKDK